MARKYTRDNRGRFASGGGGATARGGRLKTASGNKRQGQTMQAKGGPKGTIGKPKGLKPGAISGKLKPAAAANRAAQLRQRAAGLEQRGNALMGGGRQDRAATNVSLNSRARRNETNAGLRGLGMTKTAASLRSKADRVEERAQQSAAKALRTAANPKRTRSNESMRLSRAKQVEKRRGMNINNPAAWRQESAGRMAANAKRTQERALAFYKGAGKAKPAAKPGATGQKPGSVPLSQVKRYNALDRARRKEKQTYSRELSRVTGSTDRRRASAAMPKADLASRKISRIESTMRKLSNSPNTPNVPVLPTARKVGERITGRRNLYRRVTPTTQAPRVANTIARLRPKPKSSSRKPLTGVNSVVGRNLAGFKGLPVSLRSRKQAASAQAARRRNLLSYNAVSTGGTFKRGVNRQPNLLTGRVDRVGAGKFRPVTKRRR